MVKVFDLAAARTGLRKDEARAARFDPATTESRVWDHKAYYPGAHELTIRVSGCRRDGRLLGAQIVGHRGAAVATRIDVYAAILHGLRAEDLSDYDLSYTPPFGSPRDSAAGGATAS